jgi:hypothetical protein
MLSVFAADVAAEWRSWLVVVAAVAEFGPGGARYHTATWTTEKVRSASRGGAENTEKALKASVISASPRDPFPRSFLLSSGAASAVLRLGINSI